MKTLQKFAEKRGFDVVSIRYKHQFGYCKRRGFDLVSRQEVDTTGGKRRFIFASFEPVDYSNGDKWLLRAGTHKEGESYCKRITMNYLDKLEWDQHPNCM